MSSETDQPRQRTVAELLAEYGDGSATTTRRRRRRAAEDDDVIPVPEQAAPPAEPARPAPAPQAPDDAFYLAAQTWAPGPTTNPAGADDQFRAARPRTSGAADPVAYDAQFRAPRSWVPDVADPPYEQPVSSWDTPPSGPVAPASPAYDRMPEPDHTDFHPAVGVESYDQETKPAFEPLTESFHTSDEQAGDPTSSVIDSGVWRRARRIGRSLRLPDEGPPTQAAAPIDFDDEPKVDAVRTDDFRAGRQTWNGQTWNGQTWNDQTRNDQTRNDQTRNSQTRNDQTWNAGTRNDQTWNAETWNDADRHDGAWDDGPAAPDQRAGEGYRAGDDYRADEDYRPDEDYRMSPAGLDRMPGDAAVDLEPRRRLGRAAALAESAGQAWVMVVAQWIAGALAGAVVWIAFRYLWRGLPVVALAAAVLVTIGLVVLVRALLRSNDLRTTLFAVSVGLLLTVTPAILVLLGR